MNFLRVTKTLIGRRFQPVKAEMLCPSGLQQLLSKYFKVANCDFLVLHI
jgi:hypothetical protein